MNIRWRIARRLILWLLVMGLVLLSLAAVAMIWSSERLTRLEAARQFESIGLYRLVQTLQTKGGSTQYAPELLEQVRESGGWLQQIDTHGQVTESFFTPSDVPSSYGPGELTAYWLGKAPFPYQLYLWIQDKDGVRYTLLYGKPPERDILLRQLAEQSVQQGHELQVPEQLRERLEREGSWLQLLDAGGIELASFNRPKEAITSFSIQEMALRSIYPDRYNTKLTLHHDQPAGHTWALSSPLPGTKPGQQPLVVPEYRVLILGIGMLVAASMLTFMALAYGFGHQVGSPILHIMNWLRMLAEGRYEEPGGAGRRPQSLNRRGQRKRKYLIYRDVLDSLDRLTHTLHSDRRFREETQRLRDEWIAGVSHDLKTPLSSIKGYAHMLESPTYEWSAAEVRSFGKIMLDKASHLEGLIGDLTLTYQLRHGVEAPSLETINMNEYLPEALREASHPPFVNAAAVHFIPAEGPVHLDLYKPWFQRIVDNLVANAFLHNPAQTTLTVTLSALKSGGAALSFQDDGNGMDQATLERLFERYYRGTDTESASEGTGLGMAVTKALAEALGAVIEVQASEGNGTTIRLIWN
ncbi:HAMP domain-containing sensor histidine kinase [Paenibacillus filicis]|uniref:histidine kinase n=1 Tax=Paenibacillus filicis TaxID=669464 RepID=A0ABU9DWZ1_9BACL